jgi:hypothetical protein
METVVVFGGLRLAGNGGWMLLGGRDFGVVADEGRRMEEEGRKGDITTRRLQAMGTAIPYLLVCSSPPPHVSDFFLFPLVLTSSFLFHFSHLDF